MGAILKEAVPIALGSIMGSMMSGDGDRAPAAAPAPTPPTAMPTADAAEVAAARKKSYMEQMARSGRSSTIMTDSSDKLGG